MGTVGVRVVEACRLAGLPLIVHFHGYDASVHAVLEADAEAYPRLFQQASAIVAVSRAMERKLIEIGAPAEKVHWNCYGVDCDAFGGARPRDVGPLFVAVGRFVDKKAPHITLTAFASVSRQCPDARLRMIGDGPLLDPCRDLARALRVEDRVEFLGAGDSSMIQGELRNARAFVQHSIQARDGDCEGTPVVVLEAGATGLPVVSTRHGGIPDAVVEGQTGLLVDEHDVEGMAAAMLRLARDPELAGRLGEAARRKHRDEFFWVSGSIAGLWRIISASAHLRAGDL